MTMTSNWMDEAGEAADTAAKAPAAPAIKYSHGRKSRVQASAPSVKAFSWFVAKIATGEDISAVCEVRNAGRCCCCGRKLTVAESIDSGVGPVCAEKYGIERVLDGNGIIRSPLDFILSGDASLTITSKKTGVSFTFRIKHADPREGDDPTKNRPYFVNLLAGPDNTGDYTYLGQIWAG